MGLNVSSTGLDKLQQDLRDAQRAFESLDGTIAALNIDPNSQASVDAAIRQMESAIDAKTGRYPRNPLVETVAKGLKEQYRNVILERAAKAYRESGSEGRDL
jgi:hypothetical protein